MRCLVSISVTGPLAPPTSELAVGVLINVPNIAVRQWRQPSLCWPDRPNHDYLGIRHRCGHDRFDHGHKLAVHLLGLSDHCRVVDRGRGAGFLHVAGGLRRCGHPAAQAVWQPSICRAASCPFVVGFAMLRTDLRTDSAMRGIGRRPRLRTLPMVIGLPIAPRPGRVSWSGRTGRWQDLPGRGMALMAAVFLLMSQMDEWTPPLLQSLT